MGEQEKLRNRLFSMGAALGVYIQTVAVALAAPPLAAPPATNAPPPQKTPSKAPPPQPQRVFWARIYRLNFKGKGIQKLTWVNPNTISAQPQPIQLIRFIDKDKSARWGVELTFRHDSPQKNIILPEESIRLRTTVLNPKLYRIRLPISGKYTRFNLTSVLPSGLIEKEEFQIDFAQWDALNKQELEAPGGKRGGGSALQKSFSAGYSSLSYQESRVPQIQAAVLTVKGGLSGDIGRIFSSARTSPSPWSWGLSAYITALPLSTNQPDASFRFLGFNARIGYQLPIPRSPWSLRLQTGLFFTTMFVKTQNSFPRFGFQYQSGPQILLAFGRGFGIGKQISSYVKVASIPDGLQIFDTSSRELAWGLSYSHPLSSGLSGTLSVDQAWLKTQIRSTVIQSNSLSVGLGVIFPIQ